MKKAAAQLPEIAEPDIGISEAPQAPQIVPEATEAAETPEFPLSPAPVDFDALSERMMAAGQYMGMALLVMLMGLAFYNDILRILS